MPFTLPPYTPPDFDRPPLSGAPFAVFRPAKEDGVLPDDFHATSVYPEYFHLEKSGWRLLTGSRMDCGVVLAGAGSLQVRDFRHIRKGEMVACGRRENGEEGIFVHIDGFAIGDLRHEKFAFRTLASRESSYSADYDALYELLAFERQEGFILWVLGPAVAFDRDARDAMVRLIDGGFVHGLLAGNGLAVHDLEGALYGTALGLEIYDKKAAPLGHYNHLDTINRIRQAGAIEKAVHGGQVRDGIMHAAVRNSVPYVLAGSIRDDGPLPGVIGDAYAAQDEMRTLTRRATTVIALATQLHAIAVGNMTPSYKVGEDGRVRPVYFYSVDMSEFAVGKLANRGSLTARTILTNVQDFLVTLAHGLQKG